MPANIYKVTKRGVRPFHRSIVARDVDTVHLAKQIVKKVLGKHPIYKYYVMEVILKEVE